MTILGSKKKFSKYIVPILQKCIDENNIKTFVDCCVGGANIIKDIKCEKRIGIDKNQYLIALWKELQKPGFEFPSFPTREDWDRCKEGRETRDWYTGLVQSFTSYLTRGFGGGYDKRETAYWGRVHTVQKDIPLVGDIEFICDDFERIKEYTGAMIYIDPPYQNTKRYDSDKNFDYERFWQCVREVSTTNYVFVSEQVAPDDFKAIWTMDTARQLQGTITPCSENLFVFNNGLSSKFIV